MKVLLCDIDSEFTKELTPYLDGENIQYEKATSGKDCQLRLYKGNFDSLVIDVDTKSNSAIDVIKYIRLNHLKTKIILTFKSEEHRVSLDMTDETLKKMGVNKVAVKPVDFDTFIEANIFENEILNNSGDSKFVALDDIGPQTEAMIPVEQPEILLNTTVIMDYYVQLSETLYQKKWKKGDVIKVLSKEKLYFREKDRSLFIRFMNEVLDRVIVSRDVSVKTKARSMSSVADLYIQETYSKGINPKMVEEGKKISQNMFYMLEKDKKLKHLMIDYKEKLPDQYSKLFLISFFSTVIARNVEWNSPRTLEIVAMGGLLHDVGFTKLDSYFMNKKYEEMTLEEKSIYRTHPLLGVELLRESNQLSEPVAQIVYQHHELMNGEGFPNGTSGNKIYPLAKIVALADGFTTQMMHKGLSPIQAVREFIQDRRNIESYDAVLIKSLIAGFIKDK